MAMCRADETIHFVNDMQIEISYKNTKTYYKSRIYDTKEAEQTHVWHQIIVEHKGKVAGIGRKDEILDSIFRAIDGEELFPVAYRRGQTEDRFLVRQCRNALDKLFAQGLQIRLSSGTMVYLKIQLNVGEYQSEHISPFKKIMEAINAAYISMECSKGRDGILNLSQFSKSKAFTDVIIELGNRSVFQHICETVYQHDKFRKVNGIILSENKISSLDPMQIFRGVKFSILDLQKNEICSKKMCRYLQGVQADDLLLSENPITKLALYPECIMPIIQNFKRIDGVSVENIGQWSTPINFVISSTSGTKIDAFNKNKLQEFRKSNHWHAVMICDNREEYNKEQIIDYFFAIVPDIVPAVFPCYYQLESGIHKFVLRNNYHLFEHLANVENFKMKSQNCLEKKRNFYISERQNIKDIEFYFLMNVRFFEPGQIEPESIIRSILSKIYKPVDRVLNLKNFQSTKGFENIIVNFTAPKVLQTVLKLASEKYLLNCAELQLAQNKITHLNFRDIDTLVSSIKAIDLRNNWIYELSDIKSLKSAGIKYLQLEGNPLCQNYHCVSDYIKSVSRYFPNLTQLDMVAVYKGQLLPQKNFGDVKYYDLVDDFVPRFFKIFESEERLKLKSLYHPKAIFTIFFDDKLSSQSMQRFSQSANSSRNIIRLPDISRAHSSVFVGPNEIMRAFSCLPNIVHDIISFSTDTTIFNKKNLMITVSGTLKSPDVTEPDLLLAFKRTFVLTSYSQTSKEMLSWQNCYQIVNEQLSLMPPTTTQVKNFFKYIKTEPEDLEREISLADKKIMLIILQEISRLKSIWCTRLLEKATWNFEKALEYFNENLQNQQLPDSAFF